MELAIAITVIVGIPICAVLIGAMLGRRLWNRNHPNDQYRHWFRK